MKLTRSSLLHRFLAAAALCLAGGALTPACGGGSGGSAEITFKGSSDLFPGFNFDTGLQPQGSPVQASFALTAKGTGSVTAVAAPSGSESEPAITGLPGKGTLQIDGSFALVGQLKVDLSSVSSLLPKYDGPIPGLDNVSISVKGDGKFDPFSIKKATTARAAIPPTTLPKIPLPAALPGSLVLEIVEGSFMELSFTGACAGVHGTAATYSGALTQSGQLVIQPSVEIDLGALLGTKSYPIPPFTVDLALGESDLAMTAKITDFGDRPDKGDIVTASCDPTSGTGGGGAGGSGGAGGKGGTGGNGGGTGGGSGICGTTFTYSDASLDACVSASCCDELSACTKDGADEAGCAACVNDVAGGPQCDAFVACAKPCHGAVCNSGLAIPGFPGVAACLSTHCCAEYDDCTNNGADAQACSDCLSSGGGSGTICEAAALCTDTQCPTCTTDVNCVSPKTCQDGVCL